MGISATQSRLSLVLDVGEVTFTDAIPTLVSSIKDESSGLPSPSHMRNWMPSLSALVLSLPASTFLSMCSNTAICGGKKSPMQTLHKIE